MSSNIKMIIVLDKNNNFLSCCTREKAKKLCKEHKAYFVANRTLKLKTTKSEQARDKREILKDSKRVCYICNRKISEHEIATVDHVIPKSRDKYAENKFNMRCCCRRCNNDKADMKLSEYVAYIKQNRNSYLYISDKRLLYLEEYAYQYEKEYYNFYSKYYEMGETDD